jgi:hypothetical protein
MFRAYDGELDEYLERGNHRDRIRYEPNNQEGIALYEIVVDDETGERKLREIYEGNDTMNEPCVSEDANIKLIIVEKNSSDDKKKTKKHAKDKKKSKKDRKDKKKSKKDKKKKK